MTRRLLTALREAFLTPTGRQLEAYGRFLHNLATACLIAGTSILFTQNQYGGLHVAALFASGVVCFVLGAVFCRGD